MVAKLLLVDFLSGNLSNFVSNPESRGSQLDANGPIRTFERLAKATQRQQIRFSEAEYSADMSWCKWKQPTDTASSWSEIHATAEPMPETALGNQGSQARIESAPETPRPEFVVCKWGELSPEVRGSRVRPLIFFDCQVLANSGGKSVWKTRVDPKPG